VKTRRLLITGGAGFIGSNFVEYWRTTHPDDRVVVLDALTYAANPRSLTALTESGAIRLVEGDICDTALVNDILREESIDPVVHLAAESHVDRSITGPAAFIQTNVVGTHTLLSGARAFWADAKDAGRKRFHHVSTDEVYGTLTSPDEPAFREDTPYAPNSPYAASKAGSDHLVRAYNRTFGLPTTVSNCCNNFGPRQHPEKLIPLMILNMFEGIPLPVYGDGANRREWLHVHDHCRGIELVLDRGKSGDTYNIGGGSELSNLELVHMLVSSIERLMSSDPELRRRYPACPSARGESCASLITMVQDRPGHDFRYAIDGTKAQSDVGYSPQIPFTEALDETIRWYATNESWWRPLRQTRTSVG
jgi:dTDP-glucose 4,6-dehydratase